MAHSLVPGERLAGRYLVQRYHLEGSMQEVYLCHDEMLGREVALKTPLDGIRDKRFRRGAEMGARVNHSNVAATFDYFEQGDRTFLVEEFIHGADLGRRMKTEFHYMDPALAAHVIHHVSRGLQEAHRVGICHRDLKPSNVMTSVDPGLTVVKLTDFGIAKLAEGELEIEIADFNADESTLTSSTTLLGAVPYMAPECWIDWRAAGQPMDVWALGCIAYHLLTGAPPFGTGRKAIANVARFEAGGFALERPRWFSGHPSTGTLEKELWDLISVCIQSDPEKRIRSAEATARCDEMCYPDATRHEGRITTYPHIYKNGRRGDCGCVTGNDGRSLFFHKTEFFGDQPPTEGQRVMFSSYPGLPWPRVCPVLLLR